jgi:hypothetical protein
MTIVFPKNNLPEPAQPWAREIQKQLVNVIASDSANEINNAARDNQLNSSLITTTNTLNAIIGLGTPGSGYTINADNINGGTITGIVLNTASSGQRVSLESDQIIFYNSDDVGAGAIFGTTYDTETALSFQSAGGAYISAAVGYKVYSVGPFEATSTIKAFGTIRTDGSIIRDALAGGGTTGASINDNGSLIRTTSSERYKQDIEDLDIQYEDLLSLQGRRFRLKDEAGENPDARYYAGFIAEELDETSLKDFVSYEKLEDGTKRPDGVYYGELTAALLEAIKHQDQLIKSLTSRIETLEGKVE